MDNPGRTAVAQLVALAAFATLAAATLLAGTATAARGPDISWANNRVQVRSGVAGPRLCRVEVDAGDQVRSVRFSSTSRRIRVSASGKPHRDGDHLIFPCRVETMAATPPPSARLKATAVSKDGKSKTVTATAVIGGPAPAIGRARQVATKQAPKAPAAAAPAAAPASLPVAPATESGLPFSPSSFWNRPLPATAPLVAQSSAYVQELARDVSQTAAWINTTEYSTPVYVVGPNTPTTKVTIATVDPNQQASLNAVPLPANVHIAAGSDQQLVVWQPSTNSMWEFWGMRLEGGHWVTDASGAMNNVSTNVGYFDPSAWPGAKTWWGATATALPLLGGLIRIGELQRGSIEHALAIAIPQTGSSFVWPAQRSDGRNSSSTAIPEGTTFRLPASLNIDSLGLSPATHAIAIAAQKYGIVVRDTSTDVSFFAEDPTPLGSNPYPQLFGGYSPGDLASRFPWSQLVAVQQPH